METEEEEAKKFLKEMGLENASKETVNNYLNLSLWIANLEGSSTRAIAKILKGELSHNSVAERIRKGKETFNQYLLPFVCILAWTWPEKSLVKLIRSLKKEFRQINPEGVA